MTHISRIAAISLITLSIQGCSPKAPADTPSAKPAAAANVTASVAAAPTTREEISVADGIRTREVYAIKDGIRELTLEENTRNGKLHGVQRKYAKGRLVEEVQYEDGRKVKVESQEWLDEMNELRSENCILEKTPDYVDPEAKEPPMSQAMLDKWNERCNERPFSTEE